MSIVESIRGKLKTHKNLVMWKISTIIETYDFNNSQNTKMLKSKTWMKQPIHGDFVKKVRTANMR